LLIWLEVCEISFIAAIRLFIFWLPAVISCVVSCVSASDKMQENAGKKM